MSDRLDLTPSLNIHQQDEEDICQKKKKRKKKSCASVKHVKGDFLFWQRSFTVNYFFCTSWDWKTERSSCRQDLLHVEEQYLIMNLFIQHWQKKKGIIPSLQFSVGLCCLPHPWMFSGSFKDHVKLSDFIYFEDMFINLQNLSWALYCPWSERNTFNLGKWRFI